MTEDELVRYTRAVVEEVFADASWAKSYGMAREYNPPPIPQDFVDLMNDAKRRVLEGAN